MNTAGIIVGLSIFSAGLGALIGLPAMPSAAVGLGVGLVTAFIAGWEA